MSDEDELRKRRHLPDQLVKPPYIGIIKWRIDLIKKTERRWLYQKYGEDQGNCGKGLLSAGEQGNVLQFFTGGLDNNIKTGFEQIILIGQLQLSLPPAEKPGKNLFELFINLIECLGKTLSCRPVYPLNSLMKGLQRLLKIGFLLGQESMALFKLLILIYGRQVYFAKLVDLLLQFRLPESKLFFIKRRINLGGGDFLNIQPESLFQLDLDIFKFHQKCRKAKTCFCCHPSVLVFFAAKLF